MPIHVLLADDHQLLREGLRSLLEKQEDIVVVDEAENGREAVKLASTLRPDVIVMDIGMPDLNGIEATRQITTEVVGTKVVGLSMHASEKTVIEMLRAGASGYVLKLSAFDEVVQAVRTCAGGERYLSPKIAGTVLDGLMKASPQEDSAFAKLTPREREVLQLIAEGKSTKETASILGISPRTVDVHRKNIMEKLELDSVAELTRYAIREGIVPLDE
jgi:DNA-binding NarL/FixJ family response regulator